MTIVGLRGDTSGKQQNPLPVQGDREKAGLGPTQEDPLEGMTATSSILEESQDRRLGGLHPQGRKRIRPTEAHACSSTDMRANLVGGDWGPPKGTNKNVRSRVLARRCSLVGESQRQGIFFAQSC